MFKKESLAFIILLILSIGQNLWADDHLGKTPTLRVRILHAVDKVEVTGIDLTRTFLSSGIRHTFPGKKRITINCRQLKLPSYLGKSPMLLARIESNTGLTTVGNEKYSGSIIVATSPDKNNCDVINEVDIEAYISSLLSKEMNGSWPVEALKAQAIAARTYALYRIRARQQAVAKGISALFDVENSERHQVTGHFFDATTKTVQAARETRGQILLTDSGTLTETFFHASCGGHTLLPDQVWSNHVKGYQRVPCEYCQNSTKEKYMLKITSARFVQFLRWAIKDVGFVSQFLLAPDRVENGKFRVYIGEQVCILEKTLVRKFFGRFEVPSNSFVLERQADHLLILGKGNGHGVGMCQMGALDMAKKGKLYHQILSHYYPNHKLRLIYR